MREIPAAMQAQLDEGATTFCQCWRIDRNYLSPLGFTDHDENIAFDGVTFEAASGFEASGVERSLGLAIDNASATGVLTSEKITETDIQGGVYDGARIRQWLVDWRDPTNRLLTFKGDIGEIRRGERAFEVELRGLSERLNRPGGVTFYTSATQSLATADALSTLASRVSAQLRRFWRLKTPGRSKSPVLTGSKRDGSTTAYWSG